MITNKNNLTYEVLLRKIKPTFSKKMDKEKLLEQFNNVALFFDRNQHIDQRRCVDIILKSLTLRNYINLLELINEKNRRLKITFTGEDNVKNYFGGVKND